MSRIDVAYTRHQQGDLEAAEALYRAMIRDGEDVVSAANNLFILLQSQARWSALAELYKLIETEIPTHLTWATRLYMSLLSQAQFEAGWQWYEARRYAPDSPTSLPLSIPEWDGRPVRRLLVWREQGLGDQIQFSRYIVELARRGVDATFLCDPSLARLLRGLPAEVIPLASAVQLSGDYDAWCLLCSLPLRLGPPFAIPAPAPMTAAPAARGGVGIMTRGSPRHLNDAHRSMPPDFETELLRLPGATSLNPEHTGAKDFQDTADIVAGLDAIITVDTSIAHLAGSLGKPTFVLLSALGQDWRWFKGREDSPWYPSVRLLRQREAGNWRELIDRLMPLLPA